MKPSEIKLTDRDRAECDRIVLEIRPTSEAEIFETANEIMQAERARVVTLIDEDLLGLRARILAGHQEVNK